MTDTARLPVPTRRFEGLDPAALLRKTPICLPQLLALAALVTLSAAEGGYPLEHWAPAAVLIELLLLIALLTLPRGGDGGPERVTATIAVVGLALWSAASIGWADDRGAAAIATTRTALLAATFVLFARWRHRTSTALTMITALVAGLGLLTWATIARLWTAADLAPWFFWDRLLEPVGYVNAGAAFWGITALLATGLLGGAIHPAQRILGAGIAVPAAALSFLCLSRGGLLSLAIVIVLTIALLPGRARNAGAYAITGIGLALAMPWLWDVGTSIHLPEGQATLHSALLATVAGTILALTLTAIWAVLELRAAAGDARRKRAARLGSGMLAAAGIVFALAFVTGTGPLTINTVRDAVDSVTDTYEPAAVGENRLSSGLGSGRWDFWKVAWRQFEEAPLIGKGADNYRQDHLQYGTSPENPRFPHQLELRQLGQLGLIGGALMLAWIAAVLVAVRRLAAGTDPHGRALALSAGGAFSLWIVHGSADWLLEFGGLSAIVAACAGLLVAASPPSRRHGPHSAAPPTTGGRTLILRSSANTAGAALLIVAALWSAAQWVSDRDRAAALALATDQPQRALERGERARKLDFFSERSDLALGALAINRRELGAAREAYGRAHRRNPRAVAPMLWLGVIDAADDRAQAKAWLAAAAAASPRDELVKALRAELAAGRPIDPFEVRRGLAERTANLVREQPSGP